MARFGRRVAVVGVGLSECGRSRADVNKVELANESIRRCLDDAQLTMKDIDETVVADIDALFGIGQSQMWLTDDIAGYLKPGVKVETGGSIGGSACHSAVHHVAAGASDVVLVTATSKGGGARGPIERFGAGARAQAAMTAGFHPIWDRWVFVGPLMLFAFMANDYLMWSGCTREAIAKCRVKAAQNAIRNPYAHLRREVTVEQVLNSPFVIWPLRLLEFCPMTQGSAAMIFASEEKAKKITDKPVWVEDIVTAHSKQYWTDAMVPVDWGSQEAGAVALWKRNGITNPWKEIDVFEMYDPSTWAEVIWMEWMHLCGKGEAWKLVDRGATEINGEFPLNPSGGVVSTNPGVPSTTIRYIEAALQIRGDAGEHQVPGEVKRAVGHGFGGTNWNTYMLLSKDMP